MAFRVHADHVKKVDRNFTLFLFCIISIAAKEWSWSVRPVILEKPIIVFRFPVLLLLSLLLVSFCFALQRERCIIKPQTPFYVFLFVPPVLRNEKEKNIAKQETKTPTHKKRQFRKKRKKLYFCMSSFLFLHLLLSGPFPDLRRQIKKIHPHPLRHSKALRRLDGKGPLGEVRLALLGLEQGAGSILLGQPPADGASLLRSQVQGQVLLVLVEETELGALLGVDDGQDAGNRLADVTTTKEKKNKC